MVIPNHSQELAEAYQEMQEKIASMTEKDVDDTYNLLQKLNFFSSESKVYELIKEIFYIAMIRIDMYNTLAKLVVYINDKFIDSDKIIPVKDLCLNIALDPIKDDQYSWYKKSSDFRFLRALFNEGFFSAQDISNEIEEFPSKLRNQKFLLSIYFYPELYNILPETVIPADDYTYVHESLKEIVENMYNYKYNDFETLREVLENGYSKDSCFYYLKYDDFDRFCHFLPPHFNPKMTVPFNPFETHPELVGAPIINVAAFYGSVQSFRSIFQLGAETPFTMSYAVAGGCIEIVRILYSYKCSFENVLPMSVLYRQNALFNWVIEENNNWDIEKRLKESYRNSIETNNIYALMSFINEGYDVKNTDIISETTLHTAARNGNSTVFQILAGFDDVDVNALDISGNTPLRVAVDNGKHFFVTDINEIVKIEPNCHGSLLFTPLHLAVQQDNLHLVEALLKCKGINVNFQNKFGSTPLSMAKSESIRKVLLSAGAI
ncbi:hypothetical protein TVAG_087210 [Trichomonas vaginalis G3]|uniref:Uncharacterized protein n=1 Tax=Trichomonas vaginalis (strain ATCC PRA-98 / G3) TaxID=412133 RepID=A2EN35_TRIV3|nr:protein ubiquitination [Trichomonas vaginalis G3]EAY05943.1 hypothetical protein TVAG_087210 [Trichomonas vaginalis G3]KAI5530181.1 protein ubiquitination [Trichomonas vaginalis G3]|eukprot:XP_001318166.1 hypothetical protein [Trichomonas vaginalis G3]